MAEVALANAAVSADQVEVIRAAANVNMIVDGKMDCVMLVCNAVGGDLNVGRAGIVVILELKTDDDREVGESDGGDD
jgi:hypothetical protein